jgi:hypothetical protein
MNPWLRGEQGGTGMQGGPASNHGNMRGNIMAHQTRTQEGEDMKALAWRAQMVSLLSKPEGPERLSQEKQGIHFGACAHVST